MEREAEYNPAPAPPPAREVWNLRMEAPPPNDRDPGRLLGLRNWRVRSKLIAVLVIPAVAFLVLASFGIGSSIRTAQAFDRGSRLSGLGGEVTGLVHELQSERDLSAGLLAGGPGANDALKNALGDQPRLGRGAGT